jgi:hypothetical protein
MANFTWSIISIKKGGATTYAEYIWRLGQFGNRSDLAATGFGNLPAWCNGDPVTLWRAADLFERRNGAACRELGVSLPRELGLSEWIAFIEELIARDIGPKPYQYAIHSPADREGLHPHAHIIYCDRVPDEHIRGPELFFHRFNPGAPELGGCRKDSGGKPLFQVGKEVAGRRALWAQIQNRYLAAGGYPARVDPGPRRP